MKLWLVKRTDDVRYDENEEHVIRANDEQQARHLASVAHQDEDASIWFKESTTVTEISQDGIAEIILTSMIMG